MRQLAPIRVRTTGLFHDWTVICRPCGGEEVICGDWELAMESALGHLAFRHPQWPQVDTDGRMK